jgi:hypothetical protein
MLLRRMFGRMREKVKGELKRLHNEDLHSFYCSSNSIRVIICKRLRGMWCMACMYILGVGKKT